MASIAETSVKPTRIPSSSVIGIRSHSIAAVGRRRTRACRQSSDRAALRSRDAHHEIGQRRRLEGAGSYRRRQFLAAARQDRLSEPQLFRFLEPLLRMRNRPDRTRKADFAEIDAIGGKGKTGEGRNQRSRDREIGGRFGDAVAAGDVEIDVVRARSARRNAPPARRAPSTAAPRPSRRRRGAACRAARARPAPGSRPAPAACPPCRRRPPRRAPWRWRSPRNSSDGLATSRRPRSDISKTPISSVGPKRFLTVRRMR